MAEKLPRTLKRKREETLEDDELDLVIQEIEFVPPVSFRIQSEINLEAEDETIEDDFSEELNRINQIIDTIENKWKVNDFTKLEEDLANIKFEKNKLKTVLKELLNDTDEINKLSKEEQEEMDFLWEASTDLLYKIRNVEKIINIETDENSSWEEFSSDEESESFI